MESKDTQLPAEVVNAINKGAQETLARASTDLKYSAGYFDGYSLGATEYAIMLHQEQQENAQLKRWKMEAAELLAPIHAYVHKHIEANLGQCSVKLVIERCKQFEQARTLLEKVLSSGSFPKLKDYNLYTEIKTFLDGKH
jgi:hypothetical protein